VKHLGLEESRAIARDNRPGGGIDDCFGHGPPNVESERGFVQNGTQAGFTRRHKATKKGKTRRRLSLVSASNGKSSPRASIRQIPRSATEHGTQKRDSEVQ
jgi:hypothetical protein